MISLSSGQIDAIASRAGTIVKCWDIKLRGGKAVRLTSHDVTIERFGNFYSPMDSITASAEERAAGLKPKDREISGILSTSLISDEMVWKGELTQAQIREFRTDWAHPEHGIFLERFYWISNTTFDGQQWSANIEGLTSWLITEIGSVHNRVCWKHLGGVACKVKLADYEKAVLVTAVTNRRLFQISGSGLSTTTDYYSNGDIRWTGGANAGSVSPVKFWSSPSLELWTPTPFLPSIGDAGILTPGCDYTFPTCSTRFNNGQNYGGFNLMPGSDRYLQTPNTKQ